MLCNSMNMRPRLSLRKLPDLLEAWKALQAAEPGLRSRQAAQQLDCSEAELIACGAGLKSVSGVAAGGVSALLGALLETGPWMFLLRNEAAVLEVDAEARCELAGENSLRLSAEAMAVTLDLAAVRFAFWVQPLKGPQRSLHLYDARGQALLKLYLKERARVEAVDALVAPHEQSLPEAGLPVEPAPDAPPAAGPHAGEAPQCRRLLEAASERGHTVELRAGHAHGAMSVRHLPVQLKPMGPWYNILDRGMNLHLSEPHVAEEQLSHEGSKQCLRCLDARGVEVLRLEVDTPANA